MAAAPKVSKKSAAQVAAGKAYAAAGRAAQAATRAAYIKAHYGQKPPRSKAQTQASLKFAAAGRAAQAARKAGKAVPKKKAAVLPGSPLVLPGSQWPLGCNDIAPTCAATAVACHLQAATGVTLTSREIMRLHRLAGGGPGTSISDALEAMRVHSGDFSDGQIRLRSFLRTDEQLIVAGLIVGLKLGHEGHAVVSVPGGMISWGQFMPWDGEPDEAWACEWGTT